MSKNIRRRKEKKAFLLNSRRAYFGKEFIINQEKKLKCVLSQIIERFLMLFLDSLLYFWVLGRHLKIVIGLLTKFFYRFELFYLEK